MIYELQPQYYDRVRSLFGNLPNYHLCINATLDGSAPGTVVLDDAENPKIALMVAVEGTFLGGDSTISYTVLRDYIRESLCDIPAFYVDFYPEVWFDLLLHIFPQPPLPIQRQHYICTALAYDPPVPEGYEVRRIDQALLDTPGLTIPSHISEWATNNWGSVPAFLEHGFGFCAVHGDQVVSWSLADCASGTTCEIGIHTRPDYRKRGLASLTVAAMVKYALTHGFESVGWHCNKDNLGSIGVATKVGFQKERDYLFYQCVRHEAHYLAALAYGKSQAEDHVGAAEGYKQACASTDQPPWSSWYWYLAALSLTRTGQYQDAITYIRGALDRGFEVEAIRDEEEFEPLHALTEWDSLMQ